MVVAENILVCEVDEAEERCEENLACRSQSPYSPQVQSSEPIALHQYDMFWWSKSQGLGAKGIKGRD